VERRSRQRIRIARAGNIQKKQGFAGEPITIGCGGISVINGRTGYTTGEDI